MEVAHQMLLESLQTELTVHEKRLDEAQRVVEREQQYCIHLRGLIELEKGKNSDQHQNSNRFSDAVPETAKRQPAYAAMSVTQAARTILDATDKLHADELTRRIFVIDSPTKFQRAKNGVVSELVRGVKAGYFKRTGPNEFSLGPKG